MSETPSRRSVHDEALRARIVRDLRARLDSGIRFDVSIDLSGSDVVEVRYSEQTYKILAALQLGYDERQYERAIDYLVEWIEDHQEDQAYRSQRQCSLEQQQRDYASSDKTAVAGPEGPAEAPPQEPKELAIELNTQGYALAEMGKWSEAIPFYKKALEADGNHLRAWSNLGNALYATGQLQEALRCHDRSLAIDPSFDLAWANKAVVLSALRRFEEALACYNQALSLDPFNEITWFNKGSLLAKSGRYTEALATYEHILSQINPRHFNAMLAKSEALASLGRGEAAIESIDEALKIVPRDAAIFRWQATLLFDANQLARANTAIERAIEIEPRVAANWHKKAHIQSKMGDNISALRCFDLAIDLEPNDAKLWFDKGLALVNLGRHREALDVFTQARHLGHEKASKAETACQLALRNH